MDNNDLIKSFLKFLHKSTLHFKKDVLYYNHQRKTNIFKEKEVINMKNLVKKLVLSVLVACTVITAIPVTNAQAAIKPYKKYKQLWIDLDKTTHEKYIDMVHKYSKKGIKEKVQYFIGFKVKGKTQ